MGFNQTLLIKGGSASKFTDLTDTFPNYTGKAGQVIVVNPGETGLTSQVLPSGTSLPQLSDGIPVGRPALSSLAWRNQGSSTANEYSNGPIILNLIAGTVDSLRCLEQNVPSIPYALTVKLTPLLWNLDYFVAGIYLVDSAGKLMTIRVNGAGVLDVDTWNSVTSFKATPLIRSIGIRQSYWLRITNDGTNINFYFSQEGVEWLLFYSALANSFLGTVTNAGVFGDINNGASITSKISIWSFMLESGSGTNSHW